MFTVLAPCVVNDPVPIRTLPLPVTLNAPLTVTAPAPASVPPASVSLPLICEALVSVSVAPLLIVSSQSHVSVLTVTAPLPIVTAWPVANPTYPSSVAGGGVPVPPLDAAFQPPPVVPSHVTVAAAVAEPATKSLKCGRTAVIVCAVVSMLDAIAVAVPDGSM